MVPIEQAGGCSGRRPVGGSEGVEVVPRGHGWEPTQDVAQIGQGVDLPALAGDDDRVNDGGALAGVGVADEEPVFLPDGRWPDGVFYSETAITPSWADGGLSPSSGREGIDVAATRGYLVPTGFGLILAQFRWCWQS